MNQRHINRKIINNPLFKLSSLALLLGISQAQANNSVSIAEAEGGNLWFVELKAAPVASGNSKKNVLAAKAAFRQAASEAGVSFKERRAFDTLFNGFSIEVKPGERAKLMQVDGVKAIYPVEVIQAPKAEVLSSGIIGDMATALAMTGANTAQNSLGLDGSGIKVAVMDTGIDIDHPDFGGSGANGSTSFPTARVQYGYDFVGDAFNADSSSTSFTYSNNFTTTHGWNWRREGHRGVTNILTIDCGNRLHHMAVIKRSYTNHVFTQAWCTR